LNDASTVYAIVRGLKIAAVECRASGATCAGPRKGKAEKESDGMHSYRGNMHRPLEGEKAGELLLSYAYTM
jgi:hypothetical protein